MAHVRGLQLQNVINVKYMNLETAGFVCVLFSQKAKIHRTVCLTQIVEKF
jgi:hypothetical protein